MAYHDGVNAQYDAAYGGCEMDVTVRVVIRTPNGQRYEYSHKQTDKMLQPDMTWWAISADGLLDKVKMFLLSGMVFQHGKVGDPPKRVGM